MYHILIDDGSSLGTVNFTSKEVKWMGIFCIIHGLLGILFFLLFSPFESDDRLFSLLVFPGLMYDAPLIIIGGLGIANFKEWARKLVLILIDIKLLIISIAVIFIFFNSLEEGFSYLLALVYAPNGIVGPLTFGYLLVQSSVKDTIKKKGAVQSELAA